MKVLISSLEGLFSYNLDTQTLVTINDVPCFGLTRKDDRFYLFIHSPFGDKFNNPLNKDLLYNKGKIISFMLNDDDQMTDIQDVIDDLDYKTHHIAFMNDELIIQETYLQQFTIFNTINKTKYIANPFPLETFKYCHMNAVKYNNGKIFVLTPYIKINEKPKLHILDTSFNVLEQMTLPGDILHELYFEGDTVTYLSSSGKIYIYDYVNKSVVDTYDFNRVAEKWMRGLILHQDYFIIGCGKTIQKIDRVTREITVYPLNTMCFPAVILELQQVS
jgi:hypothetical protein